MLTLIVARARNGAIGKDNEIPWALPADLKMFQRETTGGALIMGRKTWDSLPFKPLPKRYNVVVTRSEGLGEARCTSVEEAVAHCYAQGYQRIYGMGGEGIYRALLPLADRLLVTEVDLEIEAADAFFPAFDESDYLELAARDLPSDGPKARLRELLRKR